jgi:cobalt-zinc-cadmium efflux system membrane fusion protein
VLARHVVPGETTGPDRTAFIVADLRTVWIEVAVYQRALAQVVTGRPVHVTATHGAAETEGTIAFVAPVVDQATRTAVARVVLPNPDGRWWPGLFVTATVLDPAAAPVVVPREAVERVDGRTAVFVVDGDHFRAQPVALGRVGRTRAEVVAGLGPGERYAVSNVFLVKAELEKGEAGHGH